MPTLYLRFGGYWIEVLKTDYVLEVTGDTCQLQFEVNSSFWALGAPAMRGYYVIHDIDQDRLGFVPQSSSDKEALSNYVAYSGSWSTKEETALEEPLPWFPEWVWWTIAALIIAAVIILLVL